MLGLLIISNEFLSKMDGVMFDFKLNLSSISSINLGRGFKLILPILLNFFNGSLLGEDYLLFVM